MIEDLLPELPERCGRQIQQRPPTEVVECNTVCEVIEGDGTSPELADEPRRKGLRLPECPAFASRLVRELRASKSEEHTSELQSRSDLVCRLLLEKKKNKQHTTTD